MMAFDRKLDEFHSKLAVKQAMSYRKELLNRYTTKVEAEANSPHRFNDWMLAQKIQNECEALEEILGLSTEENYPWH